MITYQQEFYSQVEKEIRSLIVDHWDEIALNKDKIKLNPDWDRYKLLEDNGALRIFTVRDTFLIGYFVVICANHIHYKDHIFAANDVLYLSPKYRKGRVGLNLMKFAENCLKADDVSVLVVNTKCHKPFDNLLEHLGYSHIENIYSKYIKK